MNEHAPSGTTTPGLEPIAIIGMACRVPGAAGIDEYWRNLRDGVESIRFFSREQALQAGASPRAVDDPQHMRAAPILDGVEDFDAGLFNFTRREAEILDPQHRVFLECAAAALEHAGYDPARYPGDIGVYGGVGAGEYQWYHLLQDKGLVAAVGHMAIALANNPDYAATLASYKLNLRGPSLTVSTACSTGLVAVHLACEAVRNGECDMALAGAASVELTQWHGYVYQEGSILSPDGHCRAFDADAQGTLWGSGGGVVLLKRLSDALAGGDTIHGVILGSAINNDGSDKVGFSAPSVSGQADVIRQALGVAGVDPATIDYVEAHGTGTRIGDPIEVRALSSVLAAGREPQSCWLGTVKTNIGHLAAAAGVAGLIKTVLALGHQTIPPTLHYRRPNPAIDMSVTPLRVVSEAVAWPRRGHPRRAGVSSFGMGGTNAHAVVQEAPARPALPSTGRPAILTLSAQTPSALDTMSGDLVEHLRSHPDLPLDDVAYTLQVGRRARPHRRAVVAASTADAADVLAGSSPRRLLVGKAPGAPRVAFLLPGQGTQRVGMARELYQRSAVVRQCIDEGARLLLPTLGFDLRRCLFAEGEEAAAAADRLAGTAITQPALFVVEYALARLWESWGVSPAALLGHSLGEYVACCLAGVFTFEEGLQIVAARAALMADLPAGGMLAVPMDEHSLDLDGTGLDVAAVNAPMACVVTGPTSAVDGYERTLSDEGVPVTRLATSHAFHSRMTEPLRDALIAVLARVDLQPPRIPVISNVTGAWLTAEQATDPAYWAEHMRQPVRYLDGLKTLLDDTPTVLLEVGPGTVLGGLARMQLDARTPDPVATMPTPADGEELALLTAAARLWTLGVPVDLAARHDTPRRRLPLPGHPFERQRYWVDSDLALPAGAGGAGASSEPARHGQQPIQDWFWVPGWRPAPRAAAAELDHRAAGPWLVLRDPAGHIDPLVARLRAAGADVVTVTPGVRFAATAEEFTLRPDVPDGFDELLDRLAAAGRPPRAIVHAFALGAPGDGLDPAAVRRALPLTYLSLLWLAQALAARDLTNGVHLAVVTSSTQPTIGHDASWPAGALVSGPVRALPVEFPGLTCQHVDVDHPDRAAEAVLRELGTAGEQQVVAYRRGRRWQPALEQVTVDETHARRAALRPAGTYLITGGLGGIGLSIAEDLARRVQARLVLVGRSALPPREQWAQAVRAGGRTGRQIAALMRIEELGGQVHTITADVSDPVQVATVREQARARFGPVHGIIHAAGVAGTRLLEAHTPASAVSVLEPKVFGTLALASVFRDDPLDFVVLCSSVTALAGGLGQADYCSANAFLDAFAHLAEDRLPWPVLSINWGAWLEVGMAVETATPTGLRDVEHGIRRREVSHPLLGVAETADGHPRRICTGDLGPGRHWVMDEHRILGTPTLPGTAYLEMVRAAFAGSDHSRPVELRDVVFVAPLAVPDGQERPVRVVLDDASNGGPWRVESLDGGIWREHARGSVWWATTGLSSVTDLDAVRDRCPTGKPRQGLSASASGLVTFGSRWSSLREVRAGVGEELAYLVADEPAASEIGAYGLHPALLDEATAFGDYDTASGSYLPLGYGRITMLRPMPGRLFSHLRHRDTATGELITSDITLVDEHGEVVVDIADFLLRRTGPDGGSAAAAATVDRQETVQPAAQRRADDEVGIMPGEGAEAFVRALGVQVGPQIAVTARHLPTLVAAVRQADRDRLREDLEPGGVPSAAARVADVTYVPPSTELQRTLVQLWEEAMGITGVGVEHDFFELGGNSLVATQLIARVRTLTGVKLPMRVIFESPTISAMAAMVEAGARAVS